MDKILQVLILSARHFCTVYICKDWLSYRLPFPCYLITAVTADLVSIFDSWLHKKYIYVIQDRTLAELVT